MGYATPITAYPYEATPIAPSDRYHSSVCVYKQERLRPPIEKKNNKRYQNKRCPWYTLTGMTSIVFLTPRYMGIIFVWIFLCVPLHFHLFPPKHQQQAYRHRWLRTSLPLSLLAIGGGSHTLTVSKWSLSVTEPSQGSE